MKKGLYTFLIACLLAFQACVSKPEQINENKSATKFEAVIDDVISDTKELVYDYDFFDYCSQIDSSIRDGKIYKAVENENENQKKIDLNKIFSFIINDETNFKIIIADNETKPTPSTFIACSELIKWRPQRFYVSASDSAGYEHNNDDLWRYRVAYAFKDDLFNMISFKERLALREYVCTINDSNFRISAQYEKSYVPADYKSESDVLVKFAKPIISQNGNFIFVHFESYYNHLGVTDFSHIYGTHFVALRVLENGDFEKVGNFTWLIL